MSKKENQNVQPVTEKKPENSKPVDPADAAKPVEVEFPKPPVLQIDLKSIDPNMLKTAESIGVPIGAILNYVDALQKYNLSVEARLTAIIENFEPAVQKTVMKMVETAKTSPVQATAPLGSPTPTTSPPPTGNPLLFSTVMFLF